MSQEYLLGLDNGGTVIKAALFDKEGRQVACESVRTPVSAEAQGFSERKLEDIRKANFEVIRRITEKYGNRIAGIGVTGHGKGLYLLGKQKEEIYAGIGSTDRRAQSYIDAWESDGTSEKVYELNAQKVLACQPMALLRWLKENRPEVYAKIGFVLSCKDYVRFCLSGEIFAEYTDVSGTNLLNLRTRLYDDRLLDWFGIPEMSSCLPPIVSSYDACGRVNEEASRETGLAVGTPVVGGMFDIDACALALGCAKPGDMCVIAGTWSINEYISEKVVDGKSVSMNSIFCAPAYYLAEESSATSAGNLEWFRARWKLSDYAELEKAVESVDPADCDLYYLPFLYGSNANPLARGSMVGMSEHHTDAYVARAVYEGVVYSHMTHIDALMKSLKTPRCVRLAGGVVHSAVWSQMFADAIGFDIEVMGDTELGAKGAAIAAGVGCGLYRDLADAISHCVEKGRILTPNPERHALYREKYTKYKAVSDALDTVWGKV